VSPELDSPSLQEALTLARKAAGDPGVPVLIVGEAGAPFEAFARFIHEEGPATRSGPFVVVPCEGVPEPLLEAELFGGRSDGAGTDAAPALRRARRGTLFIDRISELGPVAQARLSSAMAAGESEAAPTDEAVRIVAGAVVSLTGAVRERRFRGDLLERISIVTIRIPPLRARPNDIGRLALWFAQQRARQLGKRIDRLSDEARLKVEAHPFKGNERELRSVIERAAIIESGPTLGADAVDLGAGNSGFVSALSIPIARQEGRPATLAEIERAYIVWMLGHTRGNRTAAARMLGISYPTIAKKITDYHIDLASCAGVDAGSLPK
jgi:DNA-binding NtrC family response regulator